MKFVDTNSEYKFFKHAINRNVEPVLQSGRYLLGEKTKELEAKFSSIVGQDYSSCAVKNCTDAISIILRKELQKGMPVIIPNFGAYPTSVAVHALTNNVHYVPVDETFTMDTSKLPADIKNGIIIPVHLFGNNCDMDSIMDYASTNNHLVIEDCAQSTGSGSGSRGNFSVFSFYPTKPLASMGDGGMICSREKEDTEYFKKFRFYGQKDRKMEFVGVNSRIDEFQAAVVLAKIEEFHLLNNSRRQNSERYKSIIKGMCARSGCVYHQFPVLFHQREIIIKELKNRNIPFIIHYDSHVTDFDFLNQHQYNADFRINDKIISLPCHPFLKEDEIQKVEEFLYEFKSYEYFRKY